MRSLCACLVAIAIACLAGAGNARAEKRIFIIANNADGYGIDRCLASGSKCGAPMANSFCRTREFKRAVSFRKVGRGEITGGVPRDAYACVGRRCEEFVAIECAR